MLFQQLGQAPRDLGPAKWLGNQQDSLGFPGTETGGSGLRRITNNDDRELGVSRVVPHNVEESLAHIKGSTVQDQRVGLVLDNQFVYGDGVPRREDLVTEIPQGKGQKLGNLRRVVDEQDAAQA
jgi:hypothetical protein